MISSESVWFFSAEIQHSWAVMEKPEEKCHGLAITPYTHIRSFQTIFDQRSMVTLVVVLSELQPYVLDTQVKRAELSADHLLVVSQIRWHGRLLDSLGKPW